MAMVFIGFCFCFPRKAVGNMHWNLLVSDTVHSTVLIKVKERLKKPIYVEGEESIQVRPFIAQW